MIDKVYVENLHNVTNFGACLIKFRTVGKNWFGHDVEVLAPESCYNNTYGYVEYRDSESSDERGLLLLIITLSILIILLCISYRSSNRLHIDWYRLIGFYIIGTMSVILCVKIGPTTPGFNRFLAIGIMTHNYAEGYLLTYMWFGDKVLKSYVWILIPSILYLILMTIFMFVLPLERFFFVAMLLGATLDYFLLITLWSIVCNCHNKKLCQWKLACKCCSKKKEKEKFPCQCFCFDWYWLWQCVNGLKSCQCQWKCCNRSCLSQCSGNCQCRKRPKGSADDCDCACCDSDCCGKCPSLCQCIFCPKDEKETMCDCCGWSWKCPCICKWDCNNWYWICAAFAATLHITSIQPLFFGISWANNEIFLYTTVGLFPTFLLYMAFAMGKIGRFSFIGPSESVLLTVNAGHSVLNSDPNNAIEMIVEVQDIKPNEALSHHLQHQQSTKQSFLRNVTEAKFEDEEKKIEMALQTKHNEPLQVKGDEDIQHDKEPDQPATNFSVSNAPNDIANHVSEPVYDNKNIKGIMVELHLNMCEFVCRLVPAFLLSLGNCFLVYYAPCYWPIECHK